MIAVGSFEPDVSAHDDKHRVAIIVVYDKDGNLLYENTFKILDNSKFTSVEILDDGYVVTGQSVYDDLDVGLSEYGGAFVIKYNKKLKMEWKSNFGDSKSASYNDIVAYDGFLYAVGVVDNNIGVISKYDMYGNLIKSNYYKYTDNLGFTGIVRYESSLFIVSAKKEDPIHCALLNFAIYHQLLILRDVARRQTDVINCVTIPLTPCKGHFA